MIEHSDNISNKNSWTRHGWVDLLGVDVDILDTITQKALMDFAYLPYSITRSDLHVRRPGVISAISEYLSINKSWPNASTRSKAILAALMASRKTALVTSRHKYDSLISLWTMNVAMEHVMPPINS